MKPRCRTGDGIGESMDGLVRFATAVMRRSLTSGRTFHDNMDVVILELGKFGLESLQWSQFPNAIDTVLELETFERTSNDFVRIVLDIHLPKARCQHQLAGVGSS
jgi:hypothetical protein